MADVASIFASWSATDNSNQPQGTTAISTSLDDNLRTMQGVTVRGLSHKGSDIASATAPALGATEGLMHDITGTATITGFDTVRVGIWKILKFEGVLTLTHNATNLILPGGANITTADGDVAIFISEGSGNWRCINYSKADGASFSLPVGSMIAYGGTAAPTGWLLCYGQSLLRTDYPALFAVISTTYGAVDGTHFSLPDIRGRVVAGQDDMGGSSANRLTGVTGSVDGDVLGGTGGEETHILGTSEMPIHSHTERYSTGSATTTGISAGDTDATNNNTSITTTDSAGGGVAHNNVQPTIVLNMIIKT